MFSPLHSAHSSQKDFRLKQCNSLLLLTPFLYCCIIIQHAYRGGYAAAVQLLSATVGSKWGCIAFACLSHQMRLITLGSITHGKSLV